MGQVTAVLGMSWGDEAKGKIVDYLAKDYEVVVRFNGSLNAGHTLVVDGKKHVNRMLPCGLLHDHTVGVVTHGVMVHLETLLNEIQSLKLTNSRVFISDSAFVVLPIHKEIDIARETPATLPKQQFTIGTTKNGIGPSFEDKARRYGVRLHELKDPSSLERKLINVTYPCWIKELGSKRLSLSVNDLEREIKDLVKILHEQYLQIEPFLTNTSLFLNRMIDEGSSVLFEGAQGTLLDLDFGTYPYVTSSNCTAGAVSVCSGVPPKKIDKIIGVTKAYVTRVGEGPFPTELNEDSEEAKKIRDLGNEYGTVTKRPRRVGWLDIPMLNYACMINGVDELVMTKYDVLYDVGEVKICLNYAMHEDYIAGPNETRNQNGVPTFQTFHTRTSCSFATMSAGLALEESCRKYMDRLSIYIDAPITMYSLGPERECLFHRKPSNFFTP